MTADALTRGAHHVGLTVPDLARAESFFVDLLGYDRVGSVEEYPASFLTDGTTMITLWQASDPGTAQSFDRKNNIGLHHLALTVTDAGVLRVLQDRIGADRDCVIEFEPESLGGGPARHMMCTIPGGIRVEFIAPAG